MKGEEKPVTIDSLQQNDSQIDAQPMNVEQINNNRCRNLSSRWCPGYKCRGVTKSFTFLEDDDVEVTSGSPLPGVKPLQLDESMRIQKETIGILKDQVFAFDTFFVTSQEPYEVSYFDSSRVECCSKETRGQAARSYEKISTRMQNKFGDEYRLFLLINPEDDKPVAVVVPKTTLQPETTGSLAMLLCYQSLLLSYTKIPVIETNPSFLQRSLSGLQLGLLV
ncbi:hypothetical protein REPUB_Repub13aG0095000 [Reevesia pubescens]